MEIRKVGVVGCGLMGHGIVQVAAQGGHDVVAMETDRAALDAGLSRIEKSLAKLAQKVLDGAVALGGQEAAIADLRAAEAKIKELS